MTPRDNARRLLAAAVEELGWAVDDYYGPPEGHDVLVCAMAALDARRLLDEALRLLRPLVVELGDTDLDDVPIEADCVRAAVQEHETPEAIASAYAALLIEAHGRHGGEVGW